MLIKVCLRTMSSKCILLQLFFAGGVVTVIVRTCKLNKVFQVLYKEEKIMLTYLPIFDAKTNPLEADIVLLNGALLCTIENIVKVFDRFYERVIDVRYEERHTYFNQRCKKSIQIVIVDYSNCRNVCIALYV